MRWKSCRTGAEVLEKPPSEIYDISEDQKNNFCLKGRKKHVNRRSKNNSSGNELLSGVVGWKRSSDSVAIMIHTLAA